MGREGFEHQSQRGAIWQTETIKGGISVKRVARRIPCSGLRNRCVAQKTLFLPDQRALLTEPANSPQNSGILHFVKSQRADSCLSGCFITLCAAALPAEETKAEASCLLQLVVLFLLIIAVALCLFSRSPLVSSQLYFQSYFIVLCFC